MLNSLSGGTRGSGLGLAMTVSSFSLLSQVRVWPCRQLLRMRIQIEKSDEVIVLAIRAAVLTGRFYFSLSSNKGCL